ncbi:MAG: membrane protein insertase YidC, partial [Chitinophagaceae bacterium]
MNFDRNTVLGFVILAALFFGYFYFTNKEQSAVQKQKLKDKIYNDSIINANRPKQDTVAMFKDSLQNDSIGKVTKAGQFQAGAKGSEELVVVENELIKVTFTTKGGQPKKVELKNFKDQDSNLVKLAATDFDKISYSINTGTSSSAQTGDLFFAKSDIKKNANGGQVISFRLNSSDSSGAGPSLIHEFTLKPNDYLVDFNVMMTGADKLLTGGNMNLLWQYTAAQQESDIDFEKQNTQVGYVKDGEFDYHTISKKSSKNFDESVKWLGVRQRFFFTILVAKNNFSSGNMEWVVPPDTSKTIVRSTANMKLTIPVASSATIP